MAIACSDWEIYKGFARKFSEVCVGHLGVERELVLTPLMHDTPAELAQPFEVKDWKRGECDLIPGKTAPNMQVVERDYPNVYKRFTALGPLMTKVGNGGKGISWNTEKEVRQLGELSGFVSDEGKHAACRRSRPTSTLRSRDDAGAGDQRPCGGQGLAGAGQANRPRSHASGASSRRRKDPLSRHPAQPRKIISSPTWSGIESETVSYNAGYTNVHELIPWRTLTGRQQFYRSSVDARVRRRFLQLSPPIDLKTIAAMRGIKLNGNPEIALNFITPHQKWGIHSTYTDNLLMLTLSRGGPCVLGQRRRRQARGHCRQRLDRAVQRQRRADGARGGQPARSARHGDDVSRAGKDREHAGLGDERCARRHSQLGDAHGGQADAHDRRLRAASYGFNYYGTIGTTATSSSCCAR